MKKILVVLFVLGACVLNLSAHLCNDVFAQADDNLAVKVDVRDGQLRIGQTASFRVYLLNTMDRAIATIGLEVVSPQFDAVVEPSPDWKSFPALEAVKNGGQKQYFTVTLKRKPGVPDGKYKIDLRLFNPRNKAQEFKTVSLADAGSVKQIRTTGGINIDGNPRQEEWMNAVLCSDFYSYERSGSYFFNKRCESQPRVRFVADKENLYCLMSIPDAADVDQDVFSIYAAPTVDDSPFIVQIDRVKGELTKEGTESSVLADKAITVKKSADGKQVECKIPRAALNIAGSNIFYLNLTRTVMQKGKKQTVFWRANPASLMNPVVYEKFTIE